MSAEIPGQVSDREVIEANYAVIAERDTLQAENARLQTICDHYEKCVESYADKRQWVDWGVKLNRKWFCGPHEHGFDPAQECLARVAKLKGEGDECTKNH